MNDTSHATRSDHNWAYMAQPRFDPHASLRVLSAANPWRANTSGRRLWAEVLAQRPMTVQGVLDIGATQGLTPRETQDHLRWVYTWGGIYVEIAGQVYVKIEAQSLGRPAPARHNDRYCKNTMYEQASQLVSMNEKERILAKITIPALG